MRLSAAAALLAALAAVAGANEQGDDYAGGGAAACLGCHGEASPWPAIGILDTVHAVQANPASPFGEGGHACEGCHGPSAGHLTVLADGTRPPPAVTFGEHESAAAKDAACLDCHRQDAGHFWPGSAHRFEAVACSDCHRVHERSDPMLTVTLQNEACLSCHRRERADMLRPSSHPLQAGLMNCTDCHDPHGSSAPAMLVGNTINETCYECHAEKRGPFLWEHAPVSEDCTNCHRPHGSNHRDLLQSRTPMLCQQCHIAPFHPSSPVSGAGVPPAGADRNLLAGDCMNCHLRIHGSNHPSGARLVR